jgi:hypothetical protein
VLSRGQSALGPYLGGWKTSVYKNAMRNGRSNKHIPTEERRKMVEEMAAAGIDQVKIGRVLDISDWTLVRYYREELDKAAIRADADVGKTLLNQARGGPEKDWRLAVPACTIFWAKTRMGYRVPDSWGDEYDENGARIIRIINSPESTRISPPRFNGADRVARDLDGDGSDLN